MRAARPLDKLLYRDVRSGLSVERKVTAFNNSEHTTFPESSLIAVANSPSGSLLLGDWQLNSSDEPYLWIHDTRWDSMDSV